MAIKSLPQNQGIESAVLCATHRKQPEGLPGALRLGENLSFTWRLGHLSSLCPEEVPPQPIPASLREMRFVFLVVLVHSPSAANRETDIGMVLGQEIEMKERCGWAGTDPLYVAYHDDEWGVPAHDDRHLFEMLVLEGAQAGLSWSTILKKREGYREAFDHFDIATVAAYTQDDVDRLLGNPCIVRNRLKIQSAIKNAIAVIEIQREFGSLDAYLWQFVDGSPRQNAWRSLADVPAKTEQSDAMSKALKKRGMSFVGSTICYAFMQAVGMVNDHVTSCDRHAEIRDQISRTS